VTHSSRRLLLSIPWCVFSSSAGDLCSCPWRREMQFSLVASRHSFRIFSCCLLWMNNERSKSPGHWTKSIARALFLVSTKIIYGQSLYYHPQTPQRIKNAFVHLKQCMQGVDRTRVRILFSLAVSPLLQFKDLFSHRFR
jgi:hypothetical protein